MVCHGTRVGRQELLQRAQAKVEARARWQAGGQSGGRSCDAGHQAGADANIIRAAVPVDGGAAGAALLREAAEVQQERKRIRMLRRELASLRGCLFLSNYLFV